MKMITESQKKKMLDLGIDFVDEMTLEEAREAILDHENSTVDNKKVERKTALNIGENALVHLSDIED